MHWEWEGRNGGDLLLPSFFLGWQRAALAVSPKAPQRCPLVDTTLLSPRASASSLPRRTRCACMICSCVLLPRISLHLTTRKFTVFQLRSVQSPLRTGARNLHPSSPSPPSASQPNFLLLLHVSIAAASPPFPLLQERLSTHGHHKRCPQLSPSLPFRPHLMLPAPFRIFPNLMSWTWLHGCLAPRRAPCLPYGDHSKDPAKSHKHRISPLSREPLFSSQQVNPPWLCLGWQYSRQKVRGCGRCCSSSAARSRDCSTSLTGRVRCSLETTSHKIQPNLLQLLNK